MNTGYTTEKWQKTLLKSNKMTLLNTDGGTNRRISQKCR